MSLRKLTLAESLWSLWILLQSNFPVVAVTYLAVVGLLIAFWNQIKFLAAVHGFWVYFPVIFIALATVVGVVSGYLFIKGRIRILSEKDSRIVKNREKAIQIRNNCIQLAKEISRISADNMTRPPTHPDFHRESSPDAWWRSYHDMQEKAQRAFLERHAGEAVYHINQAREFVKIDRWRSFHLLASGSYAMQDTLNTLLEAAAKLDAVITDLEVDDEPK